MLLLSLGLASCSSIDYADLTSPVSPSNFQIDRILALNLSHADSINEANKLMDPVLVSTVVKELETRKLKNDNAAIDAENVVIFSKNVLVSDKNSKFTGPKISNSKSRGLVGNKDYQDYFLVGLKDKNTGSINHQLNVSIEYTSSARRNYSSASICDKWKGCKDASLLDINLISSDASNCTSFKCNYTAIMVLKLSDDLLRSNMNNDFSVSFNSKKINNKITFTSTYLKGYLSVAN